MIKAAFFDMDGVLYDTMRHHASAWEEASAMCGIPCAAEEIFFLEGRTGASTIDLLTRRHHNRPATNEEKQHIYTLKAKLFNARNKGEQMPGALDVMRAGKAMGLFMSVVTGSGQEGVLDKMKREFGDYIAPNSTVSALDVQHGKPHPEPYLIALKKSGVNTNEAVVIENAPLGIQAARAAGLACIAVNTGPLDDQILWDAGATLLYPSMTALAADWANAMARLSE